MMKFALKYGVADDLRSEQLNQGLAGFFEQLTQVSECHLEQWMKVFRHYNNELASWFEAAPPVKVFPQHIEPPATRHDPTQNII